MTRRRRSPGTEPPGRRPRSAAAILFTALLGAMLPALVAATATAAGHGEVYVVHGIAGQVLEVYVDDEQVLAAAEPKAIVGPLRLNPGSHQVTLRNQDRTVAQGRFAVGSGQSLDVVAHLRSDSSTRTTVTVFRNDLSAIGPGKLRLAVAHTAAAPPADLRVNGDVLFSNVANGENLTVVVPAGTYQVDIVPAATEGTAILGPVDLTLNNGTLTRVFAIGSVTTGTMDAIVHSLDVPTTGSAAPRSVPTGDGGQAASEHLGGSATAEVMMASAIGLLATAGLVTAAGRRMRGRVSS